MSLVRSRLAALVVAPFLLASACGDGAERDAPTPVVDTPITRGEAIFRRDCVGCHSLGHGDRRRAPDLLGVHQRRPSMWLSHWLTDPEHVAQKNPYAQQLVQKWGGVVMPNPGLDAAQISDVLAFIAHQSALGPMPHSAPVELSSQELDATRRLYFERCAGCHGTLRAGGTGPDIGQAAATSLGTDALAAVMRNGTPWGMPAWGRQAILSEVEIARLAALLQLPPAQGPALSLEEAKGSWELLVPVAQRPSLPEHGWDWQDFFGVILRDSGQVAIFDGTSRAEVARIDAGFAVHILRASSDGRYLYAVGRDGWVTLIDLWSLVPKAVARVRGCWDARSVESSKGAGYEQRYAIEGCYWPSQYVVLDGLTLEPLAVQGVLGETVDTGEPLSEVRVASIASVPGAPLWAVSLKESGHVALVDYSKGDFPIVARIPVERFLHDGGMDSTGRYLLVAANAKNRMEVVDLQERQRVASIETGVLPHPGRGANFIDPTFGPVNATTHLGEPALSVYGTDPIGHPEQAWTVVRKLALPSSGGLFLKTHPASPWVLMDMALSTDPEAARQICAYSKQTGQIDRCITPASRGKALQPEFNRAGSEVWVSVWDHAGELVIYDAVSLEERARITGLETPTGKFNVFNTARDVY